MHRVPCTLCPLLAPGEGGGGGRARATSPYVRGTFIEDLPLQLTAPPPCLSQYLAQSQAGPLSWEEQWELGTVVP